MPHYTYWQIYYDTYTQEAISKCKNSEVLKELQFENKPWWSVNEMEMKEIKSMWCLKRDLIVYTWSSHGYLSKLRMWFTLLCASSKHSPYTFIKKWRKWEHVSGHTEAHNFKPPPSLLLGLNRGNNSEKAVSHTVLIAPRCLLLSVATLAAPRV